jgi:hypothetical protein
LCSRGMTVDGEAGCQRIDYVVPLRMPFSASIDRTSALLLAMLRVAGLGAPSPQRLEAKYDGSDP